MKMLKYYLALVLMCALAEQDSVDTKKTTPIDMEALDDMETLIKDIENSISAIEMVPRNRLLPREDIDKLYARMLQNLERIGKYVQDSAKANKFLNADGMQRIVITNIRDYDERVTEVVLTIITTLFKVVPTLGKVIPTNVVDKLLDILEDENVELKSLAVDIMYAWLPNNPHVQARIMKMKGLESFYRQLSKLDGTTGNKLLDLFNTILEEHMHVLGKKHVSEDYADVNVYRKIGLIERMSTSAVCNGLLNVLELASSQGITAQMYKLVKNVQGFCFKFYKGRVEAIKFFDDIYEYLSKKVHDVEMNITEEKERNRKYVAYLKLTRNEL